MGVIDNYLKSKEKKKYYCLSCFLYTKKRYVLHVLEDETGKVYKCPNCPPLELVRLTIPRRVYTNTHLEYTAESVIRLYEKRDTIRGLKMVYEPQYLRFFQARFEKL